METLQEEDIISIGDLLRVIWRWLWVIVLVMLVTAAAVVGFDFSRTPVYEASIQMVVGQKQDNSAANNFAGDVPGLQQFTQTVAQVAPTRTVANAVIKKLNLHTTPTSFLANMSVQQASQTQVVEISYKDPNPKRAQQIANAIGEVFSKQISKLSPSANAITATVWEKAAVPDTPASPNPIRDGALALVLGGMLGLGLAFLLEFLDDRWRSPEELEQLSGVPTFGIIRAFDPSKVQKKGNS